MHNILLKNIPLDLLRDKRILITGATGLVGTHFLYAFDEAVKQGVKLEVFAPLHSNLPFHLTELSNRGFLHFIPATALIQSDIVIHAATYAQPDKFMEQQDSTIHLNTTVTLNLLRSYVRPGGKFLFISSSEVYSGLDHPPFQEDQIGTTDPYHPRACYIESKRCGETIVNIFRQQGVDAKSVRLSLVYGEGTRPDDTRAMNVFIKKAILNKKIELKDQGQAVRSYCYAGDAVNMMLKILLEGKQAVYNVGGKSNVTIAELAHKIAHLTGAEVIIPKEENSLVGSPVAVSLSNWNYVDEFGLRDFVPLGEGLRRTIDYQKNMYLPW